MFAITSQENAFVRKALEVNVAINAFLVISAIQIADHVIAVKTEVL